MFPLSVQKHRIKTNTSEVAVRYDSRVALNRNSARIFIIVEEIPRSKAVFAIVISLIKYRVKYECEAEI